MSKRLIIIEPDPILRKKASNWEGWWWVEKIDGWNVRNNVLSTRYRVNAVQVGILKQVIVIDISKDDQKKPLFLVNPVVTYKSKNKSIYEEGCLSLPGHFAEVERPSECHIDYVDYNGKKKKSKLPDFFRLVFNMRSITLMEFYL